MVEYTQRLNALTKPTTWLVDETGISWSEKEGKSGHIPWSKVSQVRVRFEPTRVETRRVTLHFHAPYPFQISNVEYRGFGDFKAQPEEFRAFVEAFHQFVPKDKGIRFRVGSTYPVYIMNMVITMGVIALLFAMAPIVQATGMPGGIVIARLAIILIFLPIVFKVLWLNRPRSYDPAHLPEDMLNQG